LIVSNLQAALYKMAAAGIKVNEVYHIAQTAKPAACIRSVSAIARSRHSRIRTATIGCCRKSQPDSPDASTLPRLHLAPQATWRVHFSARRLLTENTRNAPVVAMKTGPLGTLITWLPSRLVRSCQGNRHRCNSLEEVRGLITGGIMSTATPSPLRRFK